MLERIYQLSAMPLLCGRSHMYSPAANPSDQHTGASIGEPYHSRPSEQLITEALLHAFQPQVADGIPL